MATASAAKGVIKPGTDENIINLDFRKVGARGGGKAAHVPEGDYLLELTSAKNAPISNRPVSERQVALQFRIVGTPNTKESRAGMGQTVYQNAQLGEKSLWFLRNLIEDLTGATVTGKALAFRLDDKIGLRVGATLGDGKPYLNKNDEEVTNSEIKYTFPAARFVGYNPAAGTGAEEDEDEGDEEEAPAPKRGAAKSKSNGAASAADAAEAVTESSEDDEDEDLDVTELENI